MARDGSVIPKFGKKVGNGNCNSNYQNVVEPTKISEKVFEIKKFKKSVLISIIYRQKNTSSDPCLRFVPDQNFAIR